MAKRRRRPAARSHDQTIDQRLWGQQAEGVVPRLRGLELLFRKVVGARRYVDDFHCSAKSYPQGSLRAWIKNLLKKKIKELLVLSVFTMKISEFSWALLHINFGRYFIASWALLHTYPEKLGRYFIPKRASDN